MSHVSVNRVFDCFNQLGILRSMLFGKISYSPFTFKILNPHILLSLTLRTNAPTMSDACAMSEQFDYVFPIPEDQYTAVIVHLRNNFFADEPMNKAIGLFQDGEPSADLENTCLNTLKENVSIMAVNKGTQEDGEPSADLENTCLNTLKENVSVMAVNEGTQEIVKADASGRFSQKMFSSLGFELVYEVKYADYVDENGEQIFKTEAPHESLKIMVKRLE